MATATRDISFSKSAYVKEEYPNKNYSTATGTDYMVSSIIDSGILDNFLLFGGANSWPASLKRNRIIQAKVHVYLKFGTGTCLLRSCKDFTASSVTYNKLPDETDFDGSTSASAASTSVGSWKNVWVTLEDLSDAYRARAAISMLKNGAFYIEGSTYSDWTPELHTKWYSRIRLSDGTKPVVRIYYDDAVKITSKVTMVTKLSSTVNPEIANKVTWKLEKNSSYYCFDEVWTQSSAVFYWKASDESSWHTISISGTTMAATIPAFTFPTGKTISYYVKVTDGDGTTTQTTTYSCTTPASRITPQNSPTSGYVNPRDPVTFSWYFKHTNGNYPQQSASLFWRVAGAEAWNEVPASGTEQSLTVPAYPEEGSFPIASTIQWYLSGVDSSGSSSTSDTYTFSTAAAIITAVCDAPLDNVEDGSAPIEFSWEFWSNDGYPAIRTEVYWKQGSDADEAANWRLLLDEATTVTNMTVAGGTFPAGEIDWKVIATNIDGITGGEDTVGTASFVCVAAPDPVQGLAATNVPLSTIRWQSSGQEAYEITIDGEVVQKAFGPGVYNWRVPEPLEDGEHIIQVRIQGIYGLWSQPSETSIFITNEPESTLGLEGDFRLDATLTAAPEDPEDIPELHWYRDGVYIGVTTGTTIFRDRFVLGRHEYRAEIWHDSGHYTRSNTVAGTMTVRGSAIAAFSGGEWVQLRLSESSSNSQSYNWSRTVSRIHVAGTKFPVLETSPFEDLSGSFNCAFREETEARRLEALHGQIVILKSRGNHVLIGVLDQLTKKVKRNYSAYTFSIQQIHWEDFVRYDQGD